MEKEGQNRKKLANLKVGLLDMKYNDKKFKGKNLFKKFNLLKILIQLIIFLI